MRTPNESLATASSATPVHSLHSADSADATVSGTETLSPQARPSLVAAALGTMLALIAFTSPIATLNSVSAELHADVAGRTWVLSSMGVGLGAALLTAGTLADDRGRRRVAVAGLLVLAVASVAGALAPNVLALVLARVAQGVGSAAVIAASLGLIAHWFPAGPARAAASGVWGASVGAGIALGPVLSAFLDGWATWRDAFWVVAALAAVLAAWARRRLEESPSARQRPLDVAGAVLLAVAMTTFLAGLVEGRSSWTRPLVLALFAVAVGTAGAFVIVERRSASAMIDLKLFRSPRFVAATTAGLATGAGVIALLSFMPGFLGLALRVPAQGAALVFLAWSSTSVLAALLARRLPARFDGRLQLAVGLVGVAVGQLALGGITPRDSWARFLPGLLVAGVASGILNAALGREAVASVPDGRGGMGSGANNTARYVGSALGVTAVSVIVAGHVGGAGRTSGPAAAYDLVAGWNAAAVVTALISVAGAVVVLVARERPRSDNASGALSHGS